VVDTSEGRWRVTVEATDETGLVSRMTRVVKVNMTLGFLRTTPRRLYLPPQGREFEIGWQLRRAARVRVAIEALDGTVVKAYPMRRYRQGERSVVWNGLQRDGKPVKGGLYLVKVLARNSLGTVELERKLGVQRIKGSP
jgi:flagellar hook assembly protein FlgD